MKRYLTPAIIVAVCSLAIGPLFSGFFGPEWRARWILAWAANEYQNGHPEDAEKAIERASALSSELATDAEFWKLKFDLVFNKEKPSSATIAQLFDESVVQISKVPKALQAVIASYVGQLFHIHRENEMAVAIMETYYGPISKRDPAENNGIAYFRSLAKKKLETALVEIDAALVADGSAREEFLDTKAWVLHGLSKDQEALPFAEEAIKKLIAHQKKFNGVRSVDRLEFQALLFSDSAVKPEPTDPNKDDNNTTRTPKTTLATNRLDEIKRRFGYINPTDIDDLARKIAALRFHRACILDELGRNDESDLDYAWLDGFGFTETDKLN